MATKRLGRRAALSIGLSLATALGCVCFGRPARAQNLQLEASPIVHRIQSATERLEMTANTSRLLTLDQPIPRAQVNNREILELTPLSPNEVQIFAKKPGVTQINLWNEDNKVHTIDVMVFGDARELAMLIRTEFPHASIRVKPLAQSVVLSGFVDRQDHVSQIIRIAEDYYPKVISHITVGGVQQISLNVKVYEVSRTRLRTLGMDWATSNGADFLVSSVSGLINAASVGGGATAVSGGGDTVRFGIIGDDSSFFGFVEALRRNDLLKILAEPTLITVSGRPAFFNSGGEFPIIVPQSLGTSSIEYKKFGTQVDFVPIVLGNGNIRLEVRPRVSELDESRGVSINGVTVPALKERVVDTAVEMKPGQTLALAGLVQTKLESSNTGLPWLADLPYLGVPFRRVREEINEVELLILVTPEVVDAVDGNELPPCRPGMHSEPAHDHDFYLKGVLEVPSCGICAPGTTCNHGGVHHPQGYPAGGLIQQEFGPNGLPPGARIIEEVPPGSSTMLPGQSSRMNRGPSISALSSATNARSGSTATRGNTPSSRSAAKSGKKSAASTSKFSWLGKKSAPAKPSTAARSNATSRSSMTSRNSPARSGEAAEAATRYNPPSPQDGRTPVVQPGAGPSFIGQVGYDVPSR
jgi:pilus assembly protein CpaC